MSKILSKSPVKVKAFNSIFYPDRFCIGIYENELSGGTKKQITNMSDIVVIIPEYSKREIAMLPKELFQGSFKYIVPVDTLEGEVLVEEIVTDTNTDNILFGIMKLFSPTDVVSAIEQYADYEKQQSL
jgi:hypothetical protein